MVGKVFLVALMAALVFRLITPERFFICLILYAVCIPGRRAIISLYQDWKFP